MKKIAIIISSLALSMNINAQNIGVNTTGALPNTSAMLDVDASPTNNRGVLIPRVALTTRTAYAPITGAGVTSLLVYNIATAGAYPNNVTPGFYYWDGAAWQRLMNGPINAWQVTGNTLSGTLPTTPNEFIGTINNADFIFRSNNIERMRILGTGNVVVNNTAPFASDVFSAYAAGANSAVNGYATGSSEGVYGQNTGSGVAVAGISTNTSTGVYGEGPSIGTLGYVNANNGEGVFGTTSSTVTGSDGVMGNAWSTTGFGVFAFHLNTSGTGLATSGNSVVATYLPIGSGLAASGSTFAIVGFGKNVASGNGIAASGNSLSIVSFASGSGGTFQGQTFGVYGIAASTNNNTWGGYFANGTANGYAYVGGTDAIGTARKILGPGSVSSIIKNLDGKGVILTCPEAPEILIEDYGTGQLQNGKVHIDIDPIITKNIVVNEKHPLRVFIQLEGDCNGVYVTSKTSGGFDVVELSNGKSNVKFVYHIVANRADDVDANGTIVSKNADIRFSPAPEKLVPIVHESAEKPNKQINFRPIKAKQVSTTK